MNVRTIQSGAEQGSVDLIDFHIYCSVFHADSRGAIRFPFKRSYAGLRSLEVLTDPTSEKIHNSLICGPNFMILCLFDRIWSLDYRTIK